jgi:hypothetical protein
MRREIRVKEGDFFARAGFVEAEGLSNFTHRSER